MARVTVRDNSARVKAQYRAAKRRSLEIIGMEAERFAKEELSRPKPHKNGISKPNVDTGLLRNETTHKVDGDAVYIGTNTEYAPHIEFGTINSPAYPFLTPAATEHASTYKRIIQDAFSEIE